MRRASGGRAGSACALLVVSLALARAQEPESAPPAESAPAQDAPQEPAPSQSGAPTPQEPPADPAAQQGGEPQVGPPPPAPEVVGPSEPAPPPRPARAPLPSFAPSYKSFADAALHLSALASAAPEFASTFEVALASDGRPVPALQLAVPGDVPPAQRPTLFLFGALDGVSQAGSEAVLALAQHFVAAPEKLPAHVTLIAVPWAAPEGLDLRAAGRVSDGANTRALDDDRDGKVDEDPPDDMNDDGVVLDMLVVDPAGKWARCSDGRFLIEAGPLDQPRYTLVPEGRDDDGDGLFNEDPQGGVVLDRNFPLGRRGASRDVRAGVVPLSEPLSRALADLVLARPAFAVLVFQGNHGGVAMPGGVAELDPLFAADRALYERVAQQFRTATGRAQEPLASLRGALGADRPGAAIDWFAGVAGALACEVAVWGPRVDVESPSAARDARFKEQGGVRPLDARPEPSAQLAAWADWLDNKLGGKGFDDWKRSDPEGGVTALVGGWRPRTLLDPPAETLPRALEGVPRFVDELLASAPKLELVQTQAVRDGDVVRLRARVTNAGRMPSGPAALARFGGARGVDLELSLSEGAELLAGEPRITLPRLVGGETSVEVGWIVLAPPDASFRLRARAPWCAEAELGVAP